jgi:tetratricopeptide (TPR) repeat protein
VPSEFTEKQIAEHKKVYDEGWRLCEGELNLEKELPEPSWWVRRHLKQAIVCFEAALAINPRGWPSMWALGKIHERLGDAAVAFDYFSRAHLVKPDHPDVAREASLSALDLGDSSAAIAFCRAAIAVKPGDAGLLANLALALLIDGQTGAAAEVVGDALKRNPDDQITIALRRVIDEVASGLRRQPKSRRELRQVRRWLLLSAGGNGNVKSRAWVGRQWESEGVES